MFKTYYCSHSILARSQVVDDFHLMVSSDGAMIAISADTNIRFREGYFHTVISNIPSTWELHKYLNILDSITAGLPNGLEPI